ncbi:MAG: serine/threonine protein kinase [Bifidobacteriaceae bacterium]|jgi:serine/threonine-protein kinase|nr:serine/threonine protein kinase [Bifidobacteriaceae bacterium]
MINVTNGLVLANRYRFEELVARGGMGSLWRAKDITLNRTVAIKVLQTDNLDDESFAERIKFEATNNATLQHPNIVSVHDYQELDGAGFIVMEFVNGVNLETLLRKLTIPPADLTFSVLEQIARGLQEAHSRNIIHRDIKTSNILILPDGHAKITDFGVSLQEGQQNITQVGTVLGTAQYMSPEQALGKKVTPQADLYSLGIIAYEMLTGKRPFTGVTATDIAVSQVQDNALPFSKDLGIGDELEAYIFAILEKTPEKRPESAEAVANFFAQVRQNLTDYISPVENVETTKTKGKTSKKTSSARSKAKATKTKEKSDTKTVINEIIATESVILQPASNSKPSETIESKVQQDEAPDYPIPSSNPVQDTTSVTPDSDDGEVDNKNDDNDTSHAKIPTSSILEIANKKIEEVRRRQQDEKQRVVQQFATSDKIPVLKRNVIKPQNVTIPSHTEIPQPTTDTNRTTSLTLVSDEKQETLEKKTPAESEKRTLSGSAIAGKKYNVEDIKAYRRSNRRKESTFVDMVFVILDMLHSFFYKRSKFSRVETLDVPKVVFVTAIVVIVLILIIIARISVSSGAFSAESAIVWYNFIEETI